MYYLIVAMWFIVIFLALLFAIWCYAKWSCGECVCPRSDVSGKIVVITGGNRGIGRCCSLELVEGGANLIVGCRNTAKAESLRAECAEKGFKGTVRVLPLDLRTFASVRKFVDEIKKITPTVDILINNAAVGVPETTGNTEDGFEVTYQTNYLSPFLLTHLLLPIIRKNGGRIVNVSSTGHFLGSQRRLANNESCSTRVLFHQFFVYADTKLAVNYWTETLARKVMNKGITVNSCCPGFVKTEIFASGHPGFPIVRFLASIYAKRPEEGAQTTLHLVLSRDASSITGKFWSDCAVVRFLKRRLDEPTAKILWENTLKQCNVEDFQKQGDVSRVSLRPEQEILGHLMDPLPPFSTSPVMPSAT